MTDNVQKLVHRVLDAGPANLREAITELAMLADQQIEEPYHGSVLQGWVMRLPLREQGTLLTAVRGCDNEPKIWTSRGVADSPGRRITAYIRWCFMNPADPREVDVPGAFFQSQPPNQFKPSEFGHLPQHWYSHVMHSLEVIGYRHPNEVIRFNCGCLYVEMARNMHLWPELPDQMMQRLSEDRIAKGNVVS